MSTNWGPYIMVSSLLNKNTSKKVTLSESLNYDLLRQELISEGYPLETTMVNNLWYHRKSNSDKWLIIGESSDIENNFSIDWDIEELELGKHQVRGLMQVIAEEDCIEKVITLGQSTKEVTIQK